MSQEIRTIHLKGVLRVEDDPRHHRAQEIYSDYHSVRATFTPRPDGDFDVEVMEQMFIGEADRLRDENTRLRKAATASIEALVSLLEIIDPDLLEAIRELRRQRADKAKAD